MKFSLNVLNPGRNNELIPIKNGGTVIGMFKFKNREEIIYVGDDMHILVIGATRSGKSRTVVLESIGLQALAEENIICSDPKGELYQYTYPFLERLGYKVITIDFKNPLKSSRYNFLQPVFDHVKKGNIPKAIEATWDITSALVPEDAHGELFGQTAKLQSLLRRLWRLYMIIKTIPNIKTLQMCIISYLKCVNRETASCRLISM